MRSGSGLAPALAAVAIAVAMPGCGDSRAITGLAAGGLCVACHGGVDNGSGAPPNDTRGRTDTTLISVGAHSTHVAAGLDCDACHVKPSAVSSPGHGDGHVTLTWGPRATGNGTTSPSFDETTGRCAGTWCHGSFPGGNGANTPRWTHVGEGDAACGTCHGIPPASGGHPQRTGCGTCHAGYTSTSVNAATHLNGTIDVLPLSCTSCHGDPARAPTAATPLLAAAPPADTRGETSPGAPGVGAHQAHLADGTFRAALPCTECHVLPASLDAHPTGTLALDWGALATTGGASPSYAGGACASTYCHGATLGRGGSNHAPSWTGGPGEAACGTCHGIPPPGAHPQNVRCGNCHPGYGGGTVNLDTHVNGRSDVVPLTCTTCHGDATRPATALNPQLPAAPPTDTHGDQVSVHVGAHQTHLNGSALSSPVACTQCHAVPPDLTGHPTGTLALSWGSLATGAITPAVNANPGLSGFSTSAPSYAGGTCSATYCHGTYSGTFTYPIPGTDPVETNVFGYAGSAAAPTWNGAAPCGSCHGVPPTGGGVWHGGAHGGGNDCSLCHPDAVGTSLADAVISDPSAHVDGKVDLAPRFTSSCFHCH